MILRKAVLGLMAAVLAGATGTRVYAEDAAAPVVGRVGDGVVVDPKTDEIIKGTLRYLAAKQAPNGSWASPNGEHPVAVTAYCVMAFMASGHLPNEGEYGKAVQSGVQYLLSCSGADGYITSESVEAGRKASNMYDHGIATIVLGEVYGQTQDVKVKERLIKALKVIQTSQNPQGGWRYKPKPEDADVSVTVLQVVALRAAKNAGLDVPQLTIDKAVAFVKSCYDAPSTGFTYQPGNHTPGFARTAAAIYSLQVCGLYEDDLVKKGSLFITKHVGAEEQWFTYGHFYAAPAQYMVGGDTWRGWYPVMKATLLSRVITQPGNKTIAFWEAIDGDAKNVGSVYATAVYSAILATPYHYVPLYQR